MNQKEQAVAFEGELDKLVSRFCNEFDLLAVSALGILQLKAHRIIANLLDDEEEEEI